MWTQLNNFFSSWTFEGVTFAVFIVVFIILIFQLHKNKNSKFLIDNLLVDDSGRASTSKLGELIALVVSTWAVVHLVINGNITSELMGMYLAAWVVNRGFRHYISSKYKSGVELESEESYTEIDGAPKKKLLS